MNARAIAKLMLEWFDCLYSYEQELFNIFISGEINNEVFCFVISDEDNTLRIETQTKKLDTVSTIDALTDLAHLWYRVTDQKERIIYSTTTSDDVDHLIVRVGNTRIVLDIDRKDLVLFVTSYSEGVYLKNIYPSLKTEFDNYLSNAIERHCCIVYANACNIKYNDYLYYFEGGKNK